MTLVEGAGLIFQLVGEQRHAQEALLLPVLQGMGDQSAAKSLSPVIPMDNQIFQNQDKAPFCRTDGDKEVDHSNHPRTMPKDKDSPPARLFQNQLQPPDLLVLIRNKIGFLGK